MKPQKPEFPKPRLIREDFLPEPMNKYRIKKVYNEYGKSFYYPQIKILWWWMNLNLKGFDYFYDLEIAKKSLCSHIKGDVVEYIDFDPARDCK